MSPTSRKELIAALAKHGIQPPSGLGRRRLFQFAVATAVVGALLAPSPAFATPTTVTYSVAYTGADFTNIATAIASTSIGSAPIASSTGHTLQAGSTSTVLQIAAADSGTDWIGHVISVTGFTPCLITAQAGVAVTVSARATYPANVGGSPGAGVAYTIADTTIAVNVGQAAAGTNRWDLGGSGLTLSGITFDATHTLTINGNTAWNPQVALRSNFTGDPTQPVLITSNNHVLSLNLSGSGNFIFFNNIQMQCLAANQTRFVIFDTTFAKTVKVTATNCFFQTINSAYGAAIYCGTGTWTNCIVQGDRSTGSLMDTGTNPPVCVGCGFYGASETGLATSVTYLTNNGGTFTDCWIFDCIGLSSAGAAATYVRCYSDLSATGITTVTAASALISRNGAYSDLRLLSTSALIGNGGARQSTLDIFGVTRSVSASTPGPTEAGYVYPAVAAVVYSVASGGDLTSLVGASVLDNVTGPDASYFQSGQTCSGTAADSSHIVLATSASASVVGHPVTWSGVTCLITAFNSTTHVATVSAKAGYPANFGAVPQSGDVYTIAPVQNTFKVGYNATGTPNVWQLNQAPAGSSGAVGGILLTTFNTPSTKTVITAASGVNAFISSASVGNIAGQPPPCIANGLTAGDYAIFAVSSFFVSIDHLQLYVGTVGGASPDLAYGFILTNAIAGWPIGNSGFNPYQVKFTNCLGLNGSMLPSQHNHNAFASGGGTYPHDLVFHTCIFDFTSWVSWELNNGGADFIHCALLDSCTKIVTATGTFTAGATSITVSDTSNIGTVLITDGNKFPCWPSHPAIRSGLSGTMTVATVSSPGTLALSNALIGTINNGDNIYLNSGVMVGSAGPSQVLKNTLICGAMMPVNNDGAGLPTVTTCATDVAFTGGATTGSQTTNLSATGFIQVSYPAVIKSASGLGYNVTPDLRLGPGASALQGQGTFIGDGVPDFFGVARANPPTIGAIEYAAATGLPTSLGILGNIPR